MLGSSIRLVTTEINVGIVTFPAAVIVGSLPFRAAFVTTGSIRPEELEPTETPAWIRQGRRLKLRAAGAAFHRNLHTGRRCVYGDNARGPVYSTSSISITFRTVEALLDTLETF